MNKKLSLIITGPTGVGKTDFSLSLANKLNAEIINIDVGQLYKPLTIGTAKPNWENEIIPHYFFDIVNEPKDFTVFDYRKIAQQKINEIFNKHKTPIFVGGSGFYIQSLLFPVQSKSLNLTKVNIDKDLLWSQLNKIDPVRAQQIEKNDIFRLQRALEIWHTTGIKPSLQKPSYQPISNFILIVLIRDRHELYQSINDRVIEMINHGWVDEVKNLPDQWKTFLRKKKIIGYDDILNFLDGSINNERLLIETIQKKVRNYAKRQITFFKALSKKIIRSELKIESIYAKKIIWINLSNVSINNAVRKIY